MKSRNIGSGPQWLLTHCALLLLLVVNNISQAADVQYRKLEPKNWVETSGKNWPKNDPKETFYFYNENYAQGGDRGFGIKRDILEGKPLVANTKLGFSFDYWSSSDGIRFRSMKANRVEKEGKLVKTNADWVEMNDLKELTLEELRNFQYSSLDPFTIAFNNVKVNYLELTTPDSGESSPVHGYKVTPNRTNIENYDSTKSDAIYGRNVVIEFADETKVEKLKFIFKNLQTGKTGVFNLENCRTPLNSDTKITITCTTTPELTTPTPTTPKNVVSNPAPVNPAPVKTPPVKTPPVKTPPVKTTPIKPAPAKPATANQTTGSNQTSLPQQQTKNQTLNGTHPVTSNQTQTKTGNQSNHKDAQFFEEEEEEQESQEETAATPIKIKSISITLQVSTDLGFEISDLKVEGTTHKIIYPEEENPTEKVKVTSSSVFTLKKSDQKLSYMNLQRGIPKNGDVCYKLSKLQDHSIDVYFTFEGYNSGTKLLTIENTEQKFCINDYIALRNLDKYQLTFVFEGKIDKDANLLLIETEEQKDLTLLYPGENDSKISGWFYYNQIYDYSITGQSGVKAWVCDVVANCFPYSEIADDKYIIKDEYKQLLVKSPFIRIQVDDYADSFVFCKNSSDFTVEEFRTKFSSDSKNGITTEQKEKIIAQTDKTKTSFSNKVGDEKKQFSIVIPLDSIDLRAHQLITSIKMTNTTKEKPFVHLVNIIYNNGLNSDTISLPKNVQGIMKIKEMHFSTQSWFAVHSSALQSKTSGKSMEILFETIKPGTQFDFTFDVQKANLNSIEQEDSKVVVKYFSETNQTNPIDRIDTKKENHNQLVAMKDGAIFTNWIHAADGSQLKDLKLNVNLTLTIKTDKATEVWDKEKLETSIVIVRLITTQSSPIITRIDTKDLKIDSINSKILIIEDDIIKILKDGNKDANLGGSFRLSYVLTSRVKFPIDIQVKKFEVVSQKLNEQINCQGPQLASLDCRFENNQCFGTLERDSGGKCKLTNTYRWVEKGCGSSVGCSDIFDRALATSSESASADPKYVPHQVKEKEDISTHYLKVNPPETRKDTEDFCVTFEYASKEKSLWANANEASSKAYSLEFVETGLDKDQKIVPKTGQKVCASHLSNAVQDVKAIYFRFEKTPIIDADNYYMKSVVSTADSNTIQILTGIQWGDILKSENFITFNNLWVLGKNVLNFTTLNLKQLKTDNKNSYVSFLRTKWLQVPGNGDSFKQFRLGLHPSGDLDKDFYHISLNVNSPQETLISKSISSTEKELYDTKLHSFGYNQKEVKFYQLTIKLTLDLSKLDFTKKDETSVFSIAFQSFTINDPCVDETTSEMIKQCDGKTRGKIATCKRNYDTFSSECDCNDQYTGKHCEINVYCKQLSESDPKKTNEAVCKEGGATCKESGESYDCQCGKDSNWDVSVKKCIDKAVLCKENQNLVYTDGKASCVCIDDFVELKKNECTKYNPCLNEHRKARNIKEAKCADLNAGCNADSENDDPNAYICKCKTGFVNQFGLKSSDSKCLHVKCDVEQNSCEQVCKPKDEKFECACFDNYSLDNGKCKLKDSKLESKCQSKSTPAPFLNGVGNCECIQGYIWTNSTSCVLDSDKSSYFGLKFQCTKAVQLVDTKPACVCDPKTEVLDTETRSCKQRTECSAKEAEKCKQEHNTNQCKVESGEPKCGCNENQVKYAANEKESTKWVCLDKCQLFTEVYKDQACSEDFQKCDDAKVKIEGLQNNIFVNGKSVISSKKASSPSHCACLMGFEPNNGKCLPRKDPQVNVQIDFEVDKDPKLIQLYFESLIQSKLFAKSIDRIMCEKSKDTVSCSASFPSDKAQDKITAMLKDACKPIEGSAGKCAYLLPVLPKVPKSKKSKRSVTGTYYDPSVKVTNILVQDEKKAPKIESVDICKTVNPCNGFDFSRCQKIINTSHIECICDQTIFDVKSSKLEPIPQTELKMSLQTCEKKNLCNQDQYKCQPDAKCTYDVAFDAGANRYTANSFCSCGSGGNGTFTLPNRSLSCTQTCKNACGENIESCAQNIYDQKYTCLCKKGYEGAKCDSKTGTNIFLYSTIAVSVVAVLAIIGLGIFYYKRRSR